MPAKLVTTNLRPKEKRAEALFASRETIGVGLALNLHDAVSPVVGQAILNLALREALGKVVLGPLEDFGDREGRGGQREYRVNGIPRGIIARGLFGFGDRGFVQFGFQFGLDLVKVGHGLAIEVGNERLDGVALHSDTLSGF